MTSEAQKRATAKYQKAHIKVYTFRLGVNDGDIRKWFESQPNKQGYIKRLMREDMERHRQQGGSAQRTHLRSFQ